jgi:uncharacterized protein YqhQ
MEGVMIRSRKHMVLCVRNPSKEIVTNIENIDSLSEKYKILGIPFLRGIVAMFESAYLGIKGLLFSANVSLEEEETVELGYKELAAIAGMVIGIVAFFLLVPFLLATWLKLTGIAFNLVEAVVRLGMFVGYLLAISMWGEFKRVLMYHGAEHKAINAHEAGVPLTVSNVRAFSRLHPRCGTSFLFIVIVISIALYSVMPTFDFALKLLSRIALIPVIAGVSYELLRLSGKYRNSPVTRVLVAPGLLFQRLTTKEPTDDMLEVSIKAVTEVNKLIYS